MLDNTIGILSSLAGQQKGPEARSQKMPFMFEVQDKHGNLLEDRMGNVARFVFSIMPESYTKTDMPRSSLTLTQSGAFLDRIGIAPVQIALTGTFGYLGELGARVQPQSPNARDAYQMYKDLEAQFTKFYAWFGVYDQSGTVIDKPWDQANPPQLCFFDFSDQHYYHVDIQRFALNRNTQRRFLYQYDIQMTGYRAIATTAETDAIAQQFSVPSPVGTESITALSKMVALGSTILNTVYALQSDIATINGQINMMISGAISFINAPFSLVNAAIASVTDVCHNIETAPNLVNDTINTAVYHCHETQRGLYSLMPFRDLFSDYQQNQNAATATATVIASATMESIASSRLGDSGRWTEIAKLNGLQYPYIVSSIPEKMTDRQGDATVTATLGATTMTIAGTVTAGQYLLVSPQQAVQITSVDGNAATIDQPLRSDLQDATVGIYSGMLKVVTPGDSLRIPGPAQKTAIIGNSSQALFSQLFGEDEALLDDGNHAATGTGEVATVSGIDNLAMQLTHRLNTRRGELAEVGHPSYGSNIPDFIGNKSIDWAYERILMEARRSMIEDPRVKTVKNLRLSAVATATYLECDIIPINNAVTSLRILVGGA